jgi:hypothetical protein
MSDEEENIEETRPLRPTRPEKEGFGEAPRAPRSQDQPRRPRRDDDDDFEDEPRVRRRGEEEEGDVTGGLIPYKNAKALASYYCGVFSLIPCLGGVLGPIALILGFLGFSYANKHPKASGKAHAIVGIILGLLTTLGHLGVVLLILIGALSK